MAFNRQADGYEFDPVTGVCHKCKMTREKYEDRGVHPPCEPKKGGIPIPDDDE
jgi:hypothetical protein